MKKYLLILSSIVVLLSVLVSCSANSSSETVLNTDISTTAVTDSNGTARYYEPITDNNGKVSTTYKNQGVYAEIETKSDGKAVTNINGKCVTNEHTTVLPIKNETTIQNSSAKPSGSTELTTEKLSGTSNNNADNDINFNPPKPTSDTSEKNTTNPTSNIATTDNTKESTSNSVSPSKIVTDKNGWIDKWY